MSQLATSATSARWEDVEQDRLSAHFEWVLALLQLQDVSDWSAERLAQRAFTLDALETYARRGRFPRNPLTHRMAPTFVDHRGTECAVASLMLAHGLASTVERVRQTTNLAYVADMGEAVDDFAAMSGLTRGELALVQPDYCPKWPVICGAWGAGSCPGGPETCECTTVDFPDGTPCDADENACTTDTCFEGSCQAESTLDCDDGDPSTHDVCNPEHGCVSVVIDIATEGGDAGGPSGAEASAAGGGCVVSHAPIEHGSPALLLAAVFLLGLRRSRRPIGGA